MAGSAARIRGARVRWRAIEPTGVTAAKQKRESLPVNPGNGMSAKNVAVQRLSEGSRPELARHFLSLGREDVRLRFGVVISAAAIAQYVERIDFDADAVFGVYDEELALAAVAHVAFTEDMAELGVSVLPAYRGRGLGSALLARAAEHVRNRFVTRLFMHCLAENAAMMHTGEADAFVRLPPANPASVTGEFVEQRLALFDYALKSQAIRIRELGASARRSEG